MKLGRCAVLAALVLGTVTATAVPAWAAPDNDTWAGRTVIGSVPYSQTEDTTGATSDGDEAALNAYCHLQAVDASVWYEVTADRTDSLVLDTLQSSYSTGAIVATGSPGNWTVVACLLGNHIWQTVAGQTYTILVVDTQYDGIGVGGILNVNLYWAARPTADITADPNGEVDGRTGVATIHGTMICTNASRNDIYVDLWQAVGRLHTVNGSGSTTGPTCDGATHTWAIEVRPYDGKFAGGMAMVTASGTVCNLLACVIDSNQRTVMLLGRPG